MHGINYQHQQWYQRTYPWVSTSQVLTFGGYVKVRESLHTRVGWVNLIVNHNDTRVTLVGMKVLTCYGDPNGIENKNTSKGPYPTVIKKVQMV